MHACLCVRERTAITRGSDLPSYKRNPAPNLQDTSTTSSIEEALEKPCSPIFLVLSLVEATVLTQSVGSNKAGHHFHRACADTHQELISGC